MPVRKRESVARARFIVLADVLDRARSGKCIHFKTESDRVPFQRKFSQNLIAPNAERNRAALDPNDEPACFQGVNRALNEFFATRHFLSVRSSL